MTTAAIPLRGLNCFNKVTEHVTVPIKTHNKEVMLFSQNLFALFHMQFAFDCKRRITGNKREKTYLLPVPLVKK